MKNPFWFAVIKQWKEMGKGEYGVTFPFLIGAIAEVGNHKVNKELVESVFHEIIHNPVSDFYCEVRWCGNIDEPVASVRELREIENISIKSKFFSKNNANVSLAFTTDLMSMFNLNCSSNKECLEKLISMTTNNVAKGDFSKNSGVFTPFTKDDIEFIAVVSEL